MQYAMTNKWGSKRFYMLTLIGQSITKCSFSFVPANAMRDGLLGSLICYFLAYIFIGIPILYMEMVVAQFTSRNCIDVWKIRPCFSHVGYFMIIWQMTTLLVNQIYFTYIIYYILIIFEQPIPFYTCGEWSFSNCNVVTNNWSIYQECALGMGSTYIDCSTMHSTYTEWHYWRNYLRQEADEFYIVWRMIIALLFFCILEFLCCFRSKLSMKWAMPFLTISPMVLYFIMLLGTLFQIGVASKFSETIDREFTVFLEQFTFAEYVKQVMVGCNLGSGLAFNLAGSSDFRSMTYNTTVITVLVCAITTAFSILLTALSLCPYATTFNVDPMIIARSPMVFTFEKLPHLLKYYSPNKLWFLTFYVAYLIIGLRIATIIIFNIQEVFAKKFRNVAKYPGISTFICVIVLFLITIPCISNIGMRFLVESYSQILVIIPLFFVALELTVFVIWYGVGKFSEDIHFMIGIQPKPIIKMSWVIIDLVVYYVIYKKMQLLIEKPNWNWIDFFGTFFVLSNILALIIWTVVKVIIAWIKGRLKDVIKADTNWGPQNEVLYRSRAMFSAQAMTKEYLYRQYHLQAGIVERQMASNTRTTAHH